MDQKLFWVFVIIIHATFYDEVSAQFHANFWVKSVAVCETNGVVKFFWSVSTQNKNQYLDFNLSSPIALDNKIGIVTDIEVLVSNNTYVSMFTIREKYFCEAANKYLGEFWYDIERAAQVIPGTCPIAAGRYHAHHVLLNFNKMSLQTFPFGTLKLTVKALDKRNRQIVVCLVTIVENRSS